MLVGKHTNAFLFLYKTRLLRYNQGMLNEEKKMWSRGYRFVAGLDEAGRGPLAGPVVSGAVFIAPEDFLKAKRIKSVKDSKKLSPKKRQEVYMELTKNKAVKWGIGIVSEKVIDRINILEATKLSMLKAVADLEKKSGIKIDFLILDGKMELETEKDQESIIKGDDKVFSVSAASIIAKVTRDEIMLKYDRKYPQYGFAKHKGYGTKEHIENIRKYGFCSIHRKTFHAIN